MFFHILLASFIVPTTQDLARSYLRTSSINFFGNFIKPQRFNDTIKGVTIYSEKKDLNGNLFNIYLKKETNSNNFQITYAKKGVFKEINKFPLLVLYNGETITVKDGETTSISFSKSDFPLKNVETNTTIYKKTQELSSQELFICIKKLENSKFKNVDTNIPNCIKKNISNIYKEFYKRLIIPFYIPLLMLIPFLLLLTSKMDSNYNKFKTLIFLLGFFFIIISETIIRFVSSLLIKNLLLSSIPIIFISILYLFFLKKLNFKSFNK